MTKHNSPPKVADKTLSNPVSLDAIINHHIGSRLRELRQLAGLSEAQMGKKLGVAKSTIGKYEMARMRISAGQLGRVARVLRVNIDTFYSGLDQKIAANALPQPLSDIAIDETLRRESEQLCKNFGKIKVLMIRTRVLSLIAMIAKSQRL